MSEQFAKINFAQGLRHCDGQRELYRQVLACYLEQFRPLLSEEELLQDLDNARLQLHTLKSLSATIGAKDLSQLAAQLFKSWPEQSTDQRIEAIRQVNTILRLINSQIESYCNEIEQSD